MSDLDKDWILDGSGEPATPTPPKQPEELSDGFLLSAPSPGIRASETEFSDSDRHSDPNSDEDFEDDDEDADEDEDEDEDDFSGPDPAEQLRKARFMLDIDRPRDALKALQELVDWHPDHHEGWCEVARAFHSLSDKERALRAAELAIETDQYSAGGYDWKCRLQLFNDDWKGALATAETASEMTYRDPLTERWKARAWLAGGKRAEASQFLAQSPNLPDDAETACVRGEIARQGEDFPTADQEYRRAIELDPGCGEAWSGLSAVLLHQERHDDAVNCVHRAVQLEPGRPDVATRSIEVIDAFVGKKVRGLARHGIWAMLISVFCTPGPATLLIFPLGLIWYLVAKPSDHRQRDRALSTLPRDLRDYYTTHRAKDIRSTWEGLGCLLGLILGLVAIVAVLVGLFSNFGWEGSLRVLLLVLVGSVVLLWKMVDRPDKVPEIRFRFPGDPYVPEEADEDAEESEAEGGVVPDWEPSPTWAGWQLLHEGNAAAAQEKARATLSADPENVEGLTLFSAASLHLGEFETGLSAAKSACNLEPEEVRPHALVWAHLAASGKLEEAVASAQEDPAAADQASSYLVWLIRSQFHAGSLDTARSISTLVQRLYPGSSEPHEVEGDWAYESGRWAEAEAAYRRALAIEPESASLHSSLAWTLERRWRFSQAREAARRALAVDAEDENAQSVLVRMVAFPVVAAGMILALLLSLGGLLPTLMGSSTNRWMTAATVLSPLLAGGTVLLCSKPLMRRLAPGMLLDTEPWGAADPRMFAFMAAYLGLTIGLTIQTVQAWLEIGLHRELLGARWPGAATVSGLAFAVWLGIGKLVQALREDK